MAGRSQEVPRWWVRDRHTRHTELMWGVLLGEEKGERQTATERDRDKRKRKEESRWGSLFKERGVAHVRRDHTAGPGTEHAHR